MRKPIALLATFAAASLFMTGCANSEKKLSRGFNNMFEIVRLGEVRRSMEQAAFFDGPHSSTGGGFISGMNRTLARTGVGVYEVVTFPFPSYDPIFTDYLTPGPVYPDNYTPGVVDDPTFNADRFVGFSGGDIAPMVPGSKFRVFDAH